MPRRRRACDARSAPAGPTPLHRRPVRGGPPLGRADPVAAAPAGRPDLLRAAAPGGRLGAAVPRTAARGDRKAPVFAAWLMVTGQLTVTRRRPHSGASPTGNRRARRLPGGPPVVRAACRAARATDPRHDAAVGSAGQDHRAAPGPPRMRSARRVRSGPARHPRRVLARGSPMCRTEHGGHLPPPAAHAVPRRAPGHLCRGPGPERRVSVRGWAVVAPGITEVARRYVAQVALSLRPSSPLTSSRASGRPPPRAARCGACAPRCIAGCSATRLLPPSSRDGLPLRVPLRVVHVLRDHPRVPPDAPEATRRRGTQGPGRPPEDLRRSPHAPR